MAKRKNRPGTLGERCDTVIRLLGDLFILQAAGSRVNRDDIRAVLRVHTTRTSKITKGLKRAK